MLDGNVRLKSVHAVPNTMQNRSSNSVIHEALLSYLLFAFLSGAEHHEQRTHDQSADNKEITGQQLQFPVHVCTLMVSSDSEGVAVTIPVKKYVSS